LSNKNNDYVTNERTFSRSNQGASTMAIEIIAFRSYERNTLKGFFTARLTNMGLEIRDITLHQKNGKK